MTESPPSPQPPQEGGFGVPPGAAQWPQPGAGATPHAYPPPAFPEQRSPWSPPQGEPYASASGYPAPPAQPYVAHEQSYALGPRREAYPAAHEPQAYPPYPGGPAQPAYGSYTPATTSAFPVSTFILLLVSVISLVATGIIGIPSASISVVAWRANASEPAKCRKRTTMGWIVYAVNFAIGVPLLIWFYVWALSNQ